ncbi:MAG TPA: hypothetical protein VFV72_13910 [Candidatus Limnocylindrales bacterium]|nr:hypothetical protein [Candidatus Limnocylindrales bacterium]
MAMLLFAVSNVFAVHDQDFQLDGNATDDGAGDDWANVFNSTDTSIVSTFVDDPLSQTEDDIFTGGGSKDDLDIATGGVPGTTVGPWAWTIGSVPDKDNIEDAFAAAYSCDDYVPKAGDPPDAGDPDNDPDLCIYFGLDRFARNGDAQVGFWFFQSDHAKVGTTGGTFTNAHDVGDVLVLSDFTNGGVVSTIRVFRWVGTGGDTNGTLDNVFNGVACSTTTAPDLACGQSNTTAIPSPWPYTPKSGTANIFPQGSFFEGGINLSALDLDIGCGAGFLAETRSSQSVDATLKDFAEGAFNLCEITVDKTGDTLSKIGDATNYSFTITNSGQVTVFKESIIDDVIGDITDNVGLPAGVSNYSSTCGASLAPAASCTITLTFVIPAGSPDPLVNTVTATYNAESDLSGSSTSDTDDHSVNLFQPSVTVDKTGDTLSKVGDPVNYTITVTNTSSNDTPNLVNGTITDTLLGDLLDPANPFVTDKTCTATLATTAGVDSCVIHATRTVQAGDADPLPNTVTVHYNPSGFPNDITANDSHSVNLFQPSFTVDKTGDALSKVTDTVNYTITIDNTSSSDSPALVCDVEDSLLGTLASDVSIAANAANVVYTPSRVVQAGDPDPLVNTVTVTCSPDGFPNVIEHSESHSTNLFQPSVEVVKGGDTLSKVGDTVTYTFQITNNGSADSPNLILDSITDTVLGDLSDEAPAACDSLAPAASCNFNVDFVIPDNDPDPLPNTVTVHYHPQGFPNDITDSDDHSVNLFQPGVTVDKTGDTLSKIGDPASYTITVTNTGSADSPDLVNGTIVDTVLGDLLDAANPFVTASDCTSTLAAGDSCTISATRTVQAGDPDPLPNTVTVHYNPEGFSNDITDSDDHSVNLFQPSITLDKSGPAQSKVGDDTPYTVVITNTSSADSPNLVFDSITDSLQGDLTNAANYDTNNCPASLASGASCTITYTYVVQGGDPDPLLNTATVHTHPAGFPNDIHASDNFSVDLFGPHILLTKTGPATSKVGDDVVYTVTIQNTSEAGSPPLIIESITDSLQGDLTDSNNYDSSDCPAVGGQFAVGASCTIIYTYTVKAGDPDPLLNTARVETHPLGFPNSIDSEDGHTVDLFQPGVTIVKDGPALSKVGDVVTYSFEITNNTSASAPNLILDTIVDDVVGDLETEANAAGCDVLTDNEVCSFTKDYTVQAGDPDPLVNTVTVHYHPSGFPNDITDSDDHSLNLFQPSVTIDKTGDELSKVGDPVNYTITVTNTSSNDSPDLICDISDAMLGIDEQDVAIAPGANHVINDSYTVQAGDPDPLLNTASVTCSPEGFPNVLGPITDGHSVNLFQPGVQVVKGGPTSAHVGDTVTYTFAITNTGSTDGPDLLIDSVTDDVIGNLTAAASAAGCDILNDNETCNFTANYTIQAGDPNPLVNTVTVHYHPSGFPNDITDQDDHSLEVLPSGQGCTPGFWKNHTNVWDDSNDLIPVAIRGVLAGMPAPYVSNLQSGTTAALFRDTFGLTPAQMQGLNTNLTLGQAINLGGGQFRALARHGTAALLASASVNYPFTTEEVLTLVHDAFVNGDPDFNDALDLLTAANNLDHSACPQSDPSD